MTDIIYALHSSLIFDEGKYGGVMPGCRYCEEGIKRMFAAIQRMWWG